MSIIEVIMKLKSFKTVQAFKFRKTMETHYSSEVVRFDASAIYNKDINCIEIKLENELIIIPQSNVAYMIAEEEQESSKTNKKIKKED